MKQNGEKLKSLKSSLRERFSGDPRRSEVEEFTSIARAKEEQLTQAEQGIVELKNLLVEVAHGVD